MRKYRRGKDPNIPQHREGKEGRRGWGQRLRTENGTKENGKKRKEEDNEVGNGKRNNHEVQER